MNSKVKTALSGINFILNRNPRVMGIKESDISKYIPRAYRSVFIMSADFELAWAWRYDKSFKDPKEEAIRHARVSRKNVPKILRLCEKYNIPITWATVGHLFLGSCSKDEHVAHSSLRRVPYHENEYWKFYSGDWFDNDPCSDWRKSPEWYGRDLIKMILDSNGRHEIGCHTFSHIDCRDGVCSPEAFADEVSECQKLAGEFNIELESFVHPGHTIGNLRTLRELGFTSFRTDYENLLGYPLRHPNGLWELRSTLELVYRDGWSVKYHMYRYKKTIQRALRYKTVCYFWFHPSVNPILIEEVMPTLFEFIDSRRDVMWVTTTRDYVNWLNTRDEV